MDVATSDLYKAITRFDINKTLEAIKDGADMEYCDNHYSPALFWAIDKAIVARKKSAESSAVLKIVQLLIEHGANVNGRDQYCVTPILAAARSGNFRLFKILLDAGTDIYAVSQSGMNVLHYAVISGYYSNVYKNDRIIESILEDGIDIDSRSAEGTTPLIHAAKYLETDNAAYLLKRGADPNLKDNCENYSWTALNWALAHHGEEMCKILLDAGADPFIKDEQGLTSFELFRDETAQKVCRYYKEMSVKRNAASADTAISETNKFEWEI